MKIQNRATKKKARSRQAIISSAARHLRREGPARADLKTITADAGLTVGGLYNHVHSKAHLLSLGFLEASKNRRRSIADSTAGYEGRDFVTAFLKAYLAPDHRDDIEGGCPTAAILCDVPRAEEELQKAALAEIDDTLRAMAARINPKDSEAGFDEAVRVFSLAIGALQLSRATAMSPDLSEAILRAAAGDTL